jgi:RimJ/RimL family protein N-acetyltransferase
VPAFTLPDPPLRDGRFFLRGFVDGDISAFWSGTRLPEVDQAWSRKLPDEAAAREYVHEFVPARMAEGRAVVLALADATTDDFLGIVMVFLADWEQRTVETGFWLTREARGRGAAVAGIRMMTDWVMHAFGIERVWALTQPDNDGAQRALDRAGFQREGILRGFERTAEGRRDCVSFCRLATDP